MDLGSHIQRGPPVSSARTIGYKPMFDLVLERLRSEILSNHLEPGSIVYQEDLARQLGVSRMPVREALRVLAREGLVEIKRNVGVRISPLSFHDLEEVYLMRQALEEVAAGLAAPHMTDDDLTTLVALLHQMTVKTQSRNASAVLDLNTQFHRSIYRVAKRPRLERAIDELRDHSQRYRRLVVALPHRIEEVLEEHRAIYEACRARDGEGAARAVREHYDHTLKAVRVRLERAKVGAR